MLDSEGDPRGQSPSRGRNGLTSGCPPAPSGCPPASPAPPSSNRSTAWRDIAILAGGTGVSGALVAGFVPLLSRLYTPEAFGISAVFASLVALSVTLGSWSYESAIPLGENKAVAANTLALAIVIGSVMTAGFFVFLPGTELLVTTTLECPQLKPYLILLPVAFLGGSMYQALANWALRDGLFSALANTRISQSLGMVGAQAALGLGGVGLMGLIIGETFGRLIGVSTLWREIKGKVPWGTINRRDMLSAANRYKRFPLYSAPAGLLTAISTQIPVVVLATLYGPAVAGVYAMTIRVLSIPLTLIGGAINQVVLTKAARSASDPSQLRALTKSVATGSIAAGAIVYGVAAVGGEGLFAYCLGEKWYSAGTYARILTPWFLVWLAGKALSGLLTIREWQPTILLYALFECLTRLGSLWSGAMLGRPDLAIASLSIASLTIGVLTIERFFRAGYTKTADIVSATGKPLVAIAIAAIVSIVTINGENALAVAIRITVFLLTCVLIEHQARTLRSSLKELEQC